MTEEGVASEGRVWLLRVARHLICIRKFFVVIRIIWDK